MSVYRLRIDAFHLSSESIEVDATIVDSPVDAAPCRAITIKLENPNEDLPLLKFDYRAKIQLRLARAIGVLPDVKPGQEILIPWQNGLGCYFWAKLKPEGDKWSVDGHHLYRGDDREIQSLF